ncbi:hypothetical protein GCM10009115_24450 [Sphingopyxis soli]|uniref:HTH tetR-type domain-containing protein n=1 Tax=Sphingopyxis soli TaxID=592051 RepID=A0ABN1M899_9SPHN|nr:TetR/AcrR family transcriptional regulator [Sphingopyxis soli]
MTSEALSPRAARTRTALLDAGLDLLADRPIDAIAIDELVAAAGVAKGSFFNHFGDKYGFANAIAEAIRSDIEALIGALNADERDPLARLCGGMIGAAAFALSERKRAAVLMRSARGMTLEQHVLNRGVIADLGAVGAAHRLVPAAGRAGVLFWLGCCQALMGGLIEQEAARAEVAAMLSDMIALGLGGLGVDAANRARLSDAARIGQELDRAIGLLNGNR